MRILHQDILGQKEIHLYPLTREAAAKELVRFSQELWRMPNMDGYFDRRHIANMRAHLDEARHGFATLPSGGVLEILAIPAMPDEVMGFHIHNVFDPADESDHGRFIGYAVWSLERGNAPFGHAESVRMAFDIFPPYREGRYTKVPFTNHEIYNISRRILYHYKPRTFLVDARTQISQTRTGHRYKRVIYYLKRGYYPPDQKPLADACLVRLAQGRMVARERAREVILKSRVPYWIFPVEHYRRATA
ncbi:MAG TPA: hypothetical protein GYA07_16765 [Verrucomicrobia bacterium]|nr:hypothetical protein [Verrucomicrobiota bacterium]HOP97217.1 hypothetical protein [Verrucomicrobiota bacterium]HPU56387.1 hypothetical protein [Verrucomicrobiota bacterium]